jgi:SAM-dependent methyltransferase
MRWERKARIQRVFSRIPGGSFAYVRVQQRAGHLDGDPARLVARFADLMRLVSESGRSIHGARCVEIGSGQVPLIPVLLHLAGAAEVITVDVQRKAIPSLLAQAVCSLRENLDVLVKASEGLTNEAGLRSRLTELTVAARRPADILPRANVHYWAPADARTLRLPDRSVDLHFSVDTLEHVRPGELVDLLAEGRRVLRKQGIAAHLVDPSDHYARHDPCISSVNFLRFSEQTWARLAGNDYAYHNRLRGPQIAGAFEASGLRISALHPAVDRSAMQALCSGFPLDVAFAPFTPEELCSVRLDVLATPAG